jgi:hypothetical protein
MPDDLRTQLAFDIRFALRLKVVNPEARKAIRGLDEKVVDRMADDIAAHLLLCGWYHRPRSETRFSGPGLMTDIDMKGEPKKGGGE